MKQEFVMWASHLACCRAAAPQRDWWTNNHGAPDAKSYKCKQSWDETCHHQKHAGCKYTAPHLCCQRRRCWELKIWNHSCLFAQNLQLKLRKKKTLYLSERIQMQRFPLCLVISADLCECSDLFLVSKLLFNAHRQKRSSRWKRTCLAILLGIVLLCLLVKWDD